MSRTFKIHNGDIQYDVQGRPSFVSGQTKTSQDIRECTIVPVNDIGFGMGLQDLVGSVQLPAEVPSLISASIQSGIERMRTLQLLNQRLIRTDDEVISGLVALSTSLATPGSKTDFVFSYSVNTLSGANLPLRGGL